MISGTASRPSTASQPRRRDPAVAEKLSDAMLSPPPRARRDGASSAAVCTDRVGRQHVARVRGIVSGDDDREYAVVASRRARGERTAHVGADGRLGEAVDRIDHEDAGAAVDGVAHRRQRGRAVLEPHVRGAACGPSTPVAGSTQPVDLQPPVDDRDPCRRGRAGRPTARTAVPPCTTSASPSPTIASITRSSRPSTRTPSAAIAMSAPGAGQSRSANSPASPSPSTSNRRQRRSSQRGMRHAPSPSRRAPPGRGSSAPGRRRSRPRRPARARSA